ncbi:uncharacterized protein F4812DRAFT_461661 [Daldinia caldariorum]|uniref:uncharacterized protein n=1 Tax=Daldinia caldariorum TaxID=326644 RepID=UPI002007D840|nr:uncharacterized protein F4812DRAFT_461661 [Daldinia caldariorum]KAI1465353.1 hypothetical protein F4812DRAFT_461661 [Daldinia caldariorum]
MAFLQTSLSPASFLAPIHLFSYSTLLGMELYQSFVMTKVCYQELPRLAFTTLQKRIFPIYFRGMGNWIPFAVAGVTALLNLMLYGPRTRQIMIQRIHQETRDGRKSNDPVEVGEEMGALNKAFSRNHAMSIHLNLITIGATLWWGWKLASRLNVQP